MSKLRSNHNRLVAFSRLLLVASVTLFGFAACAQQVPDLKIVDLEGYPILRIDASGSVFNGADKKVAVINDREGTLTFLRDQEKIAFKHDPAIQRNKDRYIVKLSGDTNSFEVKPDGGVLFNGELWVRVYGYTQSDTQKDRFMAAIVIIPFLKEEPDDILVMLPPNVKNADQDSAIRRQPKIWIPSEDKIYVDDERVSKADFGSKLDAKIDEFLKRPAEANRIVYIAGSINVDWGTIVRVINSARERGVERIGLIVQGNGLAKNRFLVQIPPLRDPNEDISKLKPSPLLLGVALSYLQVKLITGGMEDFLLVGGQSEAKGTLSDTSSLSQTLARIFQERKQRHVYKPGLEARTDLPEDERIEKTVVIKASRALYYGDVIKIIDVVKGTAANPIVLQVDDLP